MTVSAPCATALGDEADPAASTMAVTAGKLHVFAALAAGHCAKAVFQLSVDAVSGESVVDSEPAADAAPASPETPVSVEPRISDRHEPDVKLAGLPAPGDVSSSVADNGSPPPPPRPVKKASASEKESASPPAPPPLQPKLQRFADASVVTPESSAVSPLDVSPGPESHAESNAESAPVVPRHNKPPPPLPPTRGGSQLQLSPPAPVASTAEALDAGDGTDSDDDSKPMPGNYEEAFSDPELDADLYEMPVEGQQFLYETDKKKRRHAPKPRLALPPMPPRQSHPKGEEIYDEALDVAPVVPVRNSLTKSPAGSQETATRPTSQTPPNVGSSSTTAAAAPPVPPPKRGAPPPPPPPRQLSSGSTGDGSVARPLLPPPQAPSSIVADREPASSNKDDDTNDDLYEAVLVESDPSEPGVDVDAKPRDDSNNKTGDDDVDNMYDNSAPHTDSKPSGPILPPMPAPYNATSRPREEDMYEDVDLEDEGKEVAGAAPVEPASSNDNTNSTPAATADPEASTTSSDSAVTPENDESAPKPDDQTAVDTAKVTSSQETAPDTTTADQTAISQSQPTTDSAKKTGATPPPAPPKKQNSGFFSSLFGRKKSTSAADKPAAQPASAAGIPGPTFLPLTAAEKALLAECASDAEPIITTRVAKTVVHNVDGVLDLTVGESVDILQMDSRCPVGKWIGRTGTGVLGFVVCNEVEMDPSSLKTLMALIKAPPKLTVTPEGIPIEHDAGNAKKSKPTTQPPPPPIPKPFDAPNAAAAEPTPASPTDKVTDADLYDDDFPANASPDEVTYEVMDRPVTAKRLSLAPVDEKRPRATSVLETTEDLYEVMDNPNQPSVVPDGCACAAESKLPEAVGQTTGDSSSDSDEAPPPRPLNSVKDNVPEESDSGGDNIYEIMDKPVAVPVEENIARAVTPPLVVTDTQQAKKEPESKDSDVSEEADGIYENMNGEGLLPEEEADDIYEDMDGTGELPEEEADGIYEQLAGVNQPDLTDPPTSPGTLLAPSPVLVPAMRGSLDGKTKKPALLPVLADDADDPLEGELYESPAEISSRDGFGANK